MWSGKFPEMILFVPYEELITNKEEALSRIINHLRILYNEKDFFKAIKLTSIDNMRALEKRMGHALLSNQKVPSESHIRNGGIGVWQSYLTPQTVLKIENQMNQFGLSLKMFYLAKKLEPQFNFLATDNNFKPRPRP
jgi:hypothetical protein